VTFKKSLFSFTTALAFLQARARKTAEASEGASDSWGVVLQDAHMEDKIV
jgi:hypothetical protein